MSNPRKHVKYLVAVTSILTALVAARPSVAQGTLLWQRNLNGTLNSSAGATSVAVDNLGNVVAAGYTGLTPLTALTSTASSRSRSSTPTAPSSGCRTSTAPPIAVTRHFPWRWTN
jgi:hypothetical protein